MSFSTQTNLSQSAYPNIIPLEGYNIRALFDVLRASKCENNIILQNGEVLSSDNSGFITIITDTAICVDRHLPFAIMTMPKMSCKAAPIVKAASNDLWGCYANEFISTYHMCEQYAKGEIYLTQDGKVFSNKDVELKIPYLAINNFASKLPSGSFQVFANNSCIGIGNRDHTVLAYRGYDMLYDYLKNSQYDNKYVYNNLQEDPAFINAITAVASLGTTFYLIGGKWPIHLFKNFIPYSKGDKVDFVIDYKEGSSRLLLEAIVYKKGTGTIHQFSNHLSPMTYEVRG